MKSRILIAAVSTLLLTAPLLAQDAKPTPPAAKPTATKSPTTAQAAAAAVREIEAITPPKPDMSKREDAEYIKKFRADYQAALEKRRDLAAKFVDEYPKHAKTPEYLLFMAQTTRDEAEQLALYKRIVKDFPTSPAAKQAAGPVKLADAVGKPFDLSFKDAISGKQITMASLKGKVVVVDFWATWCGPCVGEMPHNKELYSKYKDQGVEFIGVSLDNSPAEGGLKALKEFVAQNQITWPQYYQGKGWESDFSRSWGINSIPRLFIVDADGNLASTEARGKLEQLIPQLIAKRDKSKPTASIN